MNIESKDLIASLERMRDGKDDMIGRAFDRGINCAIELVHIYEDNYIKGLAKQEKENDKD